MKTEIIFTSEKQFGNWVEYKEIDFLEVTQVTKSTREETDGYVYKITNRKGESTAMFIDYKDLRAFQSTLGFILK